MGLRWTGTQFMLSGAVRHYWIAIARSHVRPTVREEAAPPPVTPVDAVGASTEWCEEERYMPEWCARRRARKENALEARVRVLAGEWAERAGRDLLRRWATWGWEQWVWLITRHLANDFKTWCAGAVHGEEEAAARAPPARVAARCLVSRCWELPPVDENGRPIHATRIDEARDSHRADAVQLGPDALERLKGLLQDDNLWCESGLRVQRGGVASDGARDMECDVSGGSDARSCPGDTGVVRKKVRRGSGSDRRARQGVSGVEPAGHPPRDQAQEAPLAAPGGVAGCGAAGGRGACGSPAAGPSARSEAASAHDARD